MESKKEEVFKPKRISFFGQMVAALWVAGFSAYKFLTNPQSIEIKDIVVSAAAIVICFSPIYLSIILDKFFERLVKKEV